MTASRAVAAPGASPAPLQSFTLKDYLQHQWSDELVHFPFSYSATSLPQSLTLTDTQGQALPTQIAGLTRKDGKVTGTAWTVVSLPPKGAQTLQLRPGKPPATTLRLQREAAGLVLSNNLLKLRLPKLPGKLAQPVSLAALPAPLLALAAGGAGPWLGGGAWVGADAALQVKEASTTVLEEGPVRATVRYRLTFTDGRFYQADVALADRQACALFTDDTDVESPQTVFRFSFQPGLQADRVYWRNHFWRDGSKGLSPGPIAFDKEQVLFKLRPWSYWWLEDNTSWAGWFREGAEPFVGAIALHPSRWAPWGWDGFDHTQVPVVARPGGQLDLSLALLAFTRKQPDGATTFSPAHREFAFTVGTVAQHVTKDDTKAKLRLQLLKYSQFPLDDVKDYGFDFKPAHPERKHPFLLFTQADLDRTRRLAQTVPVVREELARGTKYIASIGVDPVAKIQAGPDGWQKFYRENYVVNGLYHVAPLAYVGSAEPKYGMILAAGVKGMARDLVSQMLDAPSKPDLGSLAHMYPSTWASVLLAYDALADTEYLTAEEKLEIESALLFGAYIIDHPDYWNTDKGLCSANPNMTSLIRLPLGLLALYFEGHPRSAGRLKFAEDQLKDQIANWVTPGGSWVECPGYQAASLDGMFLLSQVLKNVQGKDYFAAPRFRETMDYYGFLLTPPDARFARSTPAGQPYWRILPAIGDMWTGTATVFNGWMAVATAEADPTFSAHQQSYWQGHGSFYALTGAASSLAGWTPALVDPELPATPPADLSRGFPGFGSVLRNSWTDPQATYVAHRTGPDAHHYHDDYNEIVLYAKGAPLCMDFGNLYVPLRRDESWYHNRVSFNKGDSAQKWGGSGELVEARVLPRTVDYSYGKSTGGGGQGDHRHVLLIKSADPLGANYVAIRDTTVDGQPNQQFFYNLWWPVEGPGDRRQRGPLPRPVRVWTWTFTSSPPPPRSSRRTSGSGSSTSVHGPTSPRSSTGSAS